jgi:transcriptional regulator with XRE-family HTH domain
LGDDADSVQKKIGIIRELERLTKSDFKNTDDFHAKIKTFLTNGKALSPGKQLQIARKKMGYTQTRLGVELGCSQPFIAQMERNERPLIKQAVFLIELTNYPVFDKALILKQLHENDKKDNGSRLPPYAQPEFAYKNLIDFKGLTGHKNGGQ